MDIAKLSSEYTVRLLIQDDIEQIYALCLGNPQFYRYCPPEVTRDSIRQDMTALPPGTVPEDKYYLGFFRDDRLIAVLDMILHYPDRETVFWGFFMTAKEEQGKGIGSQIVQECLGSLGTLGYGAVRLGRVKGNPQPEAFWKKNGFTETGIQTDSWSEDYTVVVMERKLGSFRSDYGKNGMHGR